MTGKYNPSMLNAEGRPTLILLISVLSRNYKLHFFSKNSKLFFTFLTFEEVDKNCPPKDLILLV